VTVWFNAAPASIGIGMKTRIIQTFDGAWSAYTCTICGLPTNLVWITGDPVPDPPENAICNRHKGEPGDRHKDKPA
jgi:hypothetical protein